MKTISSTAIVALMTATLGLTAILPAQAQTATAPSDQTAQSDMRPFHGGNGPGPRGGMDRMGDRGGMGDVLAIERGAEAIEIGLVRLSHRLDLTTEQQGLLEALKTAALAAATDFASATEGLRPTPPAEGEQAARPDMSRMLENRIAIDTARLAALESVQPAFAAFFDSLTEEQLTQLAPPQDGRSGHDRMGGKGQMGGEGRQHRHGNPGAPTAPDAPAEAPQG